VSPTDRERLRLYFQVGRDDKSLIAAAAAGVLGLGSLIAGSGWMKLLGVVLLAAAVLAFLRDRQRALPSDPQVDRWIHREIGDLLPEARWMCGVLEDQEVSAPVTISGPSFDRASRAQVGKRFGDDRRLRVTPLHVAVLLFGDLVINIYSCTLDLMTGTALNAAAEVVFYDKVVSAKIRNVNFGWHRDEVSAEFWSRLSRLVEPEGDTIQIERGQEFVLLTSAGEALKVFLGSPELIPARERGEDAVPRHDGERAVQAVWKMLQERGRAGTPANA